MRSPATPPELLYYRTTPGAILHTLATGLRPLFEQEVRLFTTPERASLAAISPFLLVEVAAEEAAAQGQLFQQVAENEWRTATLAARHLTLTPWHEITSPHLQRSLWQELQRETGPTHQLYPQLAALEATWRHQACDDVLFSNRQTWQCYVVHLTWRKAQEITGWPGYVAYDSTHQWLTQGVAPDQRDFYYEP